MAVIDWVSGVFIDSIIFFLYLPLILTYGILSVFEVIFGLQISAFLVIVTALILTAILEIIGARLYLRYEDQFSNDKKIIIQHRLNVVIAAYMPFTLILLMILPIPNLGLHGIDETWAAIILISYTILGYFAFDVLQVHYIYKGIKKVERQTIADFGPRVFILSIVGLILDGILLVLVSINLGAENILLYLFVILLFILNYFIFELLKKYLG